MIFSVKMEARPRSKAVVTPNEFGSFFGFSLFVSPFFFNVRATILLNAFFVMTVY
jgi:hypothetical protein